MAGKPMDLAGQKFGRLTVVRPTGERHDGNVVWECLCECGNTTFVRAQSLKGGRTQSCGCLRKENASKDLTGQKFGLLTAICPTEERRHGNVVWECLCDCGRTTFVKANALKSGNTKSCGCLQKERISRDLTGQRFGRLIAIRTTDRRQGSSVVWECLCDCGKTVFFSVARLVSGKAESCGCLRKKRAIMDLTGQRFGMLTAVRPTEERRGGNVVWECLCDCGKTIFVGTTQLKTGHSRSCGCLRRAVVRVDFTGQKFGRLTAVRPTEERRGGNVVWECLCDCGNTTFVSTTSLRSGNTRSCGCLHKELLVKDLSGQKFGLLTAVCPTKERNQGNVVWECRCDCGETVFASERALTGGYTQSCGCLRGRRNEE